MLQLTLSALVLVLIASVPSAQEVDGDSGRAASEYNLGKKDLAIGGFDPVAYRVEGGGAATKGKPSLEVRFQGATYRFASEKNRVAFLSDPQRYEPVYGGWCAWAMAKGDKVEVDPESFLVEEDRLLLFYDGWFNDTRKEWLGKGGAKLRPKADENWRKFSGESTASNPPNAWGQEVGLGGLDPVLHVQDELVAGKPEFATRVGGVVYHFSDARNRVAFLGNPAGFLPLYGGHAANAFAGGERSKGDPRVYLRKNGRAVLFRDEAGRDAWRMDAAQASQADQAWKSLLEKQKVTR